MKLAPYPEYKDSGVEWLGKVPSHWEVKPLVYCANFRTGKAHEPYIDDDGEFICVNSRFVSTEGATEKFCSKNITPAREGDILMVMSDLPNGRALAKAYHVKFEKNLAVNQRVCAISVVNDKSRFLFFYLNRCPGLLIFDDGINQTHISNDGFTKLPISLPPLPEQIAIAAYLDAATAKIDALMREQDELIALLKEKRQALISHCVTKGLDPSAPLKDSGIEWLGKVPEHWVVTKFLRCTSFQEGPGLRHWQFTDDGVRVICVTNITGLGIDFTEYSKFISRDEYLNIYRHFKVNRGDLLLSSSGNSWGKISKYENDEECILNTSTIRVFENSCSSMAQEFTKWILQSRTVRDQLELAMTGSCQPNFGPSHLAKLLVPLPPRSEQTAIAAFLDAETAKIDALMEEAEAMIERMCEHRSSLISHVVTGKVRVMEVGQ